MHAIDGAPLLVTDDVASSVLSLPMFPDLRNEHVERVADRIESLQNHATEVEASIDATKPTSGRQMLRFG